MSVSIETGTVLANQALKSLEHVLSIQRNLLTGSAVVTGEGNDIDIVILQPFEIGAELVEHLEQYGWVLCGEASYESQGMFAAFRKGDVNIIVVEDDEYFRKWETALEVCKYLHLVGLSDKTWRVTMHKIIVDDADAAEFLAGAAHV